MPRQRGAVDEVGMKPDENLEVPSRDEQDAFYTWVMSFAEGMPNTLLLTEQGEPLEV